MIERLRAALAQRPLAWFFALAGVAFAGFVTFAATRPYGFGQVWLNRFHDASRLVVVPIAVACLWAVGGPADKRPRRPAQILLIVGGAVLVMVVACIQLWAQWRALNLRLDEPWFSLSAEIRRQLRDPWSWSNALAVGLVLGATVSPLPAVRRGALALVKAHAHRVWLLVAVSLLVPAACVAAARVGVLFVRLSGGASGRSALTLIGAQALGQLLWYVPVVFVFYGFVAERLQMRLSPLATGLVLAATVSGSYQLGWWVVNVRLGDLYPYDARILLWACAQAAVALPAVWLARRAGSLLPAWLLLATSGTGLSVVEWMNASQSRMAKAEDLYCLATIAAAAVFVVAGHMWRRPEAPLPTAAYTAPGGPVAAVPWSAE